ncbi:MAG: ComF family protein [Oscillospiraceae bacterium]|nr:ComF family protein [Oscillospiraceae bacterium]
MGRLISGLLDLLFPPKCAFCRRLVKSDKNLLCPACRANLPYTEDGGAQHGDFFRLCVSALYYEDRVREALLRYKFQGSSGYAGTFGRLLADCIRANLRGQYDLISWVPLSRERLRERGYDQAMLLAQAAALELQDVAVSTLDKVRNAEKQSGVGSAEKRRANISGAYRVADAELIQGRRILLIDDIVTTGATLSECARTLLEGGASQVVCATVARGRD